MIGKGLWNTSSLATGVYDEMTTDDYDEWLARAVNKETKNPTHPLKWYYELRAARDFLIYGVDDIHDVAVKFKLLDEKPVTNHVMVRCPNPEHEDNNPSCSLWRDINGFRCWSCGVKGTMTRLIELIKERGLKERRNVKKGPWQDWKNLRN